MLRSLYSGISGLRAEQTMLDVTGNNIANVNTVGFKSSSVQFEDTLSQTLSAAGLPTAQKGGINPNQVGLGVKIGSIATSLVQGAQQTTGNNMDEMISGDGYFLTKAGGESLYTRNGSFHWDSQGRLATADGALVQGWSATNGVIQSGQQPGTIAIGNQVSPAKQSTSATMAGNLPSGAKVGDSFERDITVYSADGSEKTLAATFTATASNTWDYSIDDGSSTPATGTLQTGGATVTATAGSTTPTVGGIAVDMSKLTGYADLTSVAITGQNGNKAGTLLSTTMSSDGTLTGNFSNGATIPLAQLSVATFGNPAGLEKAGSSTLRQSINSGVAQLNSAGQGTAGSIVAGALEMSNVDLSQEFTNLIVAQRGFQANARIITTSDEILQELTQLKR
jgi:flagellar hook protein FlgE